MSLLSPFWYAAARLGGRLDLSPLIDAGIPPTRWSALSQAALVAGGVAPRHAALLARPGPALEHVSPVVTLADPLFPALLRPLPTAPPVLFLDGDPALLTMPAVSVVGARRCTGDGARMARRIARAVADAGGVVVSGLAHGIDSAAHSAAPQATIAVLGQALDRPFSRSQQRVVDDIRSSGGLVVSEFLPGTPAARYTFPRRNRVIAGLAALTVVVEAGERSGSLITARLAAAFGRDVMAVPGNPQCAVAAGCLRLLQEGAGMVVDPLDVVEAVPALVAPAAGRPVVSDDPLLAALAVGDRSFDDLMGALRLSPVALTRALGLHELGGRVVRRAGDRFALARGPTGVGSG